MPSRESLLSALTAASWRAAAIVGVGACAGLTINALRTSGPKFERYAPAAVCSGVALPQEIRVLQPQQAARLCGDERTLVADVRSAAAFTQGHVAGAVHIPCSGSRADLEQVRLRLASKEALVVYGDSEEQARQVANDLAGRINRPELSVAVIAGGWHAWLDAGMACASGPCDDCEGLVSHAPK
jgi:rhodanese-related sulfurtransferase